MCFLEISGELEPTEPSTRTVLVANLTHPRYASGAMKTLCRELPLGDFDLLHLKRIRKQQQQQQGPGEQTKCQQRLTILLGPPKAWESLSVETRTRWETDHGLELKRAKR